MRQKSRSDLGWRVRAPYEPVASFCQARREGACLRTRSMQRMGYSKLTAAERVALYSEPEPMSGCVLWAGAVSKTGYPVFRAERKQWRVNRWVLRAKIGRELLASEQACHRCDTPSCINPRHLFVGTNSENQYDSVAKRRHRQARKGSCPKGHPLRGENLILERRPQGSGLCRRCRACRNAAKRIESMTTEQHRKANAYARARYHAKARAL